MADHRCKPCLGTYNDTTPDGYQYFHSCAPTGQDKGNPVERPGKRDENLIFAAPGQKDPPREKAPGAGRDDL